MGTIFQRFPFRCNLPKYFAVPGYCYYDRPFSLKFRLASSVQKSKPWSVLSGVLPPDSPDVRSTSLRDCSFWDFLSDEAPFGNSYGVHCCSPSKIKCFGLAPYFISGKFSEAETSWLSFRRQAQPSKEHLAVAGVCRLPLVSLRWPASALLITGFPRWIRSSFQLSRDSRIIIFGAAFYRSPDTSKLIQKTMRVKYLALIKVNRLWTGVINKCW